MIQAIGLTSVPRRHQLKPAVDDLTFEARPGRVTVLLGPEGSGKTTALRLMLQLQAGRGTALFRGRPVHRVHHLAREVGVLLGEVNGHPGRTARGHLKMLAAAAGVPAGRADDVLDVVGLSGLSDQRMSALSRGMDRRLGMACALLGDPHTLVLDEPSLGLSPRETAWLYSLLRGYANQGGTVLLTSRRSREAAEVADRVVSIDSGRLIADQGAADYVRTRLRPRVAVRTPHAERLVAVLTQEGRKAGAGRDGGPLKVVREGGTKVSVYGSSCAEVGEHAYRNGILVHQLTDESGDTGDAHRPGPLDRADGRRPAGAPARAVAPGTGTASAEAANEPSGAEADRAAGAQPAPGASKADASQTDGGGHRAHEAPISTSGPGTSEANGTPVEPRRDQVLLGIEEMEEIEEIEGLDDFEEPATASTASTASAASGASPASSKDAPTGDERRPEPEPEPVSDLRPEPGSDPDDGDRSEPVLVASATRTAMGSARSTTATTSAPVAVAGVASVGGEHGEAPADGAEAEAEAEAETKTEPGHEAGPEPTPADAPTVRISDAPLTAASTESTDSTPAPSGASSASRRPVLFKPLADPDAPGGAKSLWTPRSPQARASAELPPQLHAVARPGPAAPLRYELCRFASVRSTWVAMAVTVAVALCVALVMARTGMGVPSGSGDPLPPVVRLLTSWPSGGGLFLLPPVAVAAGLLGAWASGEEFRYPVLAPARAPVPRRLSLLAAKLAVTGTLAVLLSIVVAAVNAAGVSLVFGSEALALPAGGTSSGDLPWQLHLAAVFAFAAGCAWAGVLAGGIFRSATVGTAVVVAVPLLLAPVVRALLGGDSASARSTDGLPGRLEAALLVPWPPGTERWVSALLELASQPVGSALVLSLAALLAGYLVTALSGKAR
ncbi:ATP-binding cassette domain-containing protein [Streptomyces winkii]|uniref:ATP-binding cassette domain-containing protein n=1 Tax=Streptomyces winkii TaxID=3051178 RepID=UPI0028D1085F|nr:ATP-binding cassette domain-containing protein [Streptomyces sp. DSM 40971]